MRFIKRFIVIIVLLLLAFFVYRLISPSGAKALLYDLKSFFNDKFGTHFSLETTQESLTGSVIDMTGMVVDDTGIIDDTGILQEFIEDDALLLNPDILTEDISGTGASSSDFSVSLPESTSTALTSSTSITSTSSTSSSTKGLSSKDLKDFKNLFSK